MLAAFIILIVPVIWGVMRLVLPTVNYDMDFDTAHGTFFAIYLHYAKTAWAIFWAGLVGAVAYQRFVGHGDAPVYLAAAGVYALLFNLWLLFTYERYLHGRYLRDGRGGVSNYTASKYALTMALGISAVQLFVLGIAVALTGMGV